MRIIATAAAGILLATTIASAFTLNLSPPELNYTPIELVQAQKKDAPAAKKEMPAAKKNETVTQKVKRTWRRWTTPSHSFCVRCPIPIPVTSKTCTAKGKTADAARSVCQQQNPICYVSTGKC